MEWGNVEIYQMDGGWRAEVQLLRQFLRPRRLRCRLFSSKKKGRFCDVIFPPFLFCEQHTHTQLQLLPLLPSFSYMHHSWFWQKEGKALEDFDALYGLLALIELSILLCLTVCYGDSFMLGDHIPRNFDTRCSLYVLAIIQTMPHKILNSPFRYFLNISGIVKYSSISLGRN